MHAGLGAFRCIIRQIEHVGRQRLAAPGPDVRPLLERVEFRPAFDRLTSGQLLGHLPVIVAAVLPHALVPIGRSSKGTNSSASSQRNNVRGCC